MPSARLRKKGKHREKPYAKKRAKIADVSYTGAIERCDRLDSPHRLSDTMPHTENHLDDTINFAVWAASRAAVFSVCV